MSRARNLVLVTIDSLRADHVGYSGYSVATTPVLDRLSRESVVYSQAVASGIPTYYSFPALHTARFPLALGRELLGLAPGEATLASRLRNAGFTTAAFVATNPYLTQRLHYDQGFDSFEDSFSTTSPPSRNTTSGLDRSNRRELLRRINSSIGSLTRHLSPLRRLHEEAYFQYAWRSRSRRSSGQIESLRKYPGAETVVDGALEWIGRQSREPFFLWLHLMDPHYPYFPPAEALRAIGRPDLATAASAVYLNGLWNRDEISQRRLTSQRDAVIALYDASIHAADQQIGRLVDGLENQGRWNNTLFVLTADHGEQFLENGEKYHAPTSMSQSLLGVPLMLRSPGLAATRIDDPVALVDLAPTVCRLLAVNLPPDLHDRSSWAFRPGDETPRDPIVSEAIVDCRNPWDKQQRLGHRLLAVQGKRYKVEINFATGEETYSRLYRWSREERIDVASCPPFQRHRLLSTALEHLRRRRSPTDEKHRLRSQLRDLGRELAPRVG